MILHFSVIFKTFLNFLENLLSKLEVRISFERGSTFQITSHNTGGALKFFERELEGKIFFKKVFPQ